MPGWRAKYFSNTSSLPGPGHDHENFRHELDETTAMRERRKVVGNVTTPDLPEFRF